MHKPTGKPGALTDRIFRCIEIECRIQDEANAAILGADSAESGHSRDDGDSALSEVVADNTLFDDVGNDNDGGDDEEEDEDKEVVAVNAPDDENDNHIRSNMHSAEFFHLSSPLPIPNRP
jgi:hypothetical protein